MPSLLLLGGLALLAFSQTANGQPSSAQLSSDSREALWQETKHPVVRSLAQLRQLQADLGKQPFEVDLKAQLTFSAQYWSVFFVQDGDVPAMVHCTDAASAILCERPPGQRLRIRGLVYGGQVDIRLVDLELLPETLPLHPLVLNSIPPRDKLPIDRVVEMPCRLVEVLDNFTYSVLFAKVNSDLIEMQVESFLTPQQYAAVQSRASAVAMGTLSPKYDRLRNSYCAIRMIGTEQLKVLDESLSAVPPKEPALQGQILYTDLMSQVIVGTDSGARRVSTRFAEALSPGQHVALFSVKRPAESFQPIESVHMRLEKAGNLPESVALSVGAWEQARHLPLRVSLEAIVVRQAFENGQRYYQMRSANTQFVAIVNERANTPELYRIGDRIRLTGTPLIDPAFPRNSADRLKLFVVKSADTEFVSAPVQLSMAHFAWSASIAAVLVLIASGWNWLLRRQVNERTLGLKKISSHLHMSFDAISEAVLISDADGHVSAWNRQFAELFGKSPTKDEPIDNALALISQRLSPQRLSKRDEWLTIRRASEDRREDRREDRGENRPATPLIAQLELANPNQVVRAFVSSIVDNDGTYHGHIYTFEDITEKERLENELFQSQKMEAIGHLSGGVAHDFNNLLTVISANLSLIKFMGGDSNTTEYVHSAETAVKRAAELTQQLLDFSRKSKLELQVVNLNELVGRVGLLLRRTFDKSITLQIELCATPLYVNLDVNRIEQVLINICINARDALKGRSGQIGLRVMAPDQACDSSVARIEVEDNGCGMSRDVLARIFDPFFTTKEPGEGTGLGLSMAQGVIEQLGGRISCQSEPGVGTRFLIDLPLAESFASPTAATKSEHPSGTGRRTIPSLKILLVDDEPMVRKAGQALLRELGHVPTTACGGREALEMLGHESFDAVLLDLNMPDMNGKETYTELRRRWPELPVAICTGYYVDMNLWNAQPNSDGHAQPSGSTNSMVKLEPPRVISKPYSIDTLVNYLQSVASKSRAS